MLRDWIKENTKSDGTTIIVNENISILPPRTNRSAGGGAAKKT